MKKELPVKKPRAKKPAKIKFLPPTVTVPEELRSQMKMITDTHEKMKTLLWHAIDLYGTTPNQKFKDAQDSIVIVINMFKALNRHYANMFLGTMIPEKDLEKTKKVTK